MLHDRRVTLWQRFTRCSFPRPCNSTFWPGNTSKMLGYDWYRQFTLSIIFCSRSSYKPDIQTFILWPYDAQCQYLTFYGIHNTFYHKDCMTISYVHGRPQCLPWKCCKVLFVLQMLSKVSVDEVFMHYFEKMLSAYGGFSPRSPPGLCPWISLGNFRSLNPSQGCIWWGIRGFDPPQEVADPPESSAEPLWGVDSNPPKNPLFHFLAKPVYLCTTIRRLRLYRDRRDLI